MFCSDAPLAYKILLSVTTFLCIIISKKRWIFKKINVSWLSKWTYWFLSNQFFTTILTVIFSSSLLLCETQCFPLLRQSPISYTYLKWLWWSLPQSGHTSHQTVTRDSTTLALSQICQHVPSQTSQGLGTCSFFSLESSALLSPALNHIHLYNFDSWSSFTSQF